MVLINGVKYACERCIRGHRVTACTHTDQPLTMIKPKGRPALQCQHCRDQRKNKNIHTSCNCGKKGKSPGVHLALCPCHKGNHCICGGSASTLVSQQPGAGVSSVGAQASVLQVPPKHIHPHPSRQLSAKLELNRRRSLLERSASDLSLPLLHSVAANGHDSSQHYLQSQHGLGLGLGLGSGSGSGSGSVPNLAKTGHASSTGIMDTNYVIEDVVLPFESGLGYFELFLPSPDLAKSKSTSEVNIPDVSSVGNNVNYYSELSRNSSIQGGSKNPSSSPPALSQEEVMEIGDNMFPLFPLVGTTSFDTSNKPLSAKLPSGLGPSTGIVSGASGGPPHYHQHIRPKRPESVLSVNSISSTNTSMSKNIDTHSSLVNGTSSAYPPFSYSQSSFDLNALSNQQTYKEGSGEDFERIGLGLGSASGSVSGGNIPGQDLVEPDQGQAQVIRQSQSQDQGQDQKYLDLLEDFADGYKLDGNINAASNSFQSQQLQLQANQFDQDFSNMFSEEQDLKLEAYEQLLTGIREDDRFSQQQNFPLVQNHLNLNPNLNLNLNLNLNVNLTQPYGTQTPLSPPSQQLPRRLSLLQRLRQLLQLLQHLLPISRHRLASQLQSLVQSPLQGHSHSQPQQQLLVLQPQQQQVQQQGLQGSTQLLFNPLSASSSMHADGYDYGVTPMLNEVNDDELQVQDYEMKLYN